MKIASIQFDMKDVPSSAEYFCRCELMIDTAKKNGVEVLLFPEYASLPWLLTMVDTNNFHQALRPSQEANALYLAKWQELSDKYNVLLIPPSIPHCIENNFRNRAWILSPHKTELFQDKIYMTRFEKETWNIQPGKPEIQTFLWNNLTCAVAICYDVEFPAYSLALSKAKVDVLFVPSCTDDSHGYWRVRHCAEARAVENQCYVVLSSVVGGNPVFKEIGQHQGQGAVFGPCDFGFSLTGLVTQGEENKEDLVVAEVSGEKIRRLKKHGTVLNSIDQNKNLEIIIKDAK